MRNKELEQAIFSVKKPADFEKVALQVYNFQYEHNQVYRAFCENLNKPKAKHTSEIPFLPISFFKTHQVLTNSIEKDDVLSETQNYEALFMSSGTTGTARSKHFIKRLDLYELSFYKTFHSLIGNPEEVIICALLPNYLEQGDSSLVYMVDKLIAATKNPLSGFYLHDTKALITNLKKALSLGKRVILFGVSYALLDLAEEKHNLKGLEVIETGGMKGRKKELIREELHDLLQKGLSVEFISSEYGMTELLSQGYLMKNGWFQCAPWMKILIRDVNDPFSFLTEGRTGGINVIDLANIYSCSFIATDDLGVSNGKDFKVLGRFDNSDIRGCNLLIQ